MEPREKKTGYDKLVNWKILFLPISLLILIIVLPAPKSMKDVGLEYAVGPKAVTSFFTQSLFSKVHTEAEQWQLLAARIMEQNMQMGVLGKDRFLKRDMAFCKANKIPADETNLVKAQAYIKDHVSDDDFLSLMKKGLELRKKDLVYDNLSEKDKKLADTGAWHIKVAVGLAVFVAICFVTECIPLPGVALSIGLIVVFTGLVTRKEVAMLYWDDACWFIMGSLMFASAFVKTGVDKRICLMLFKKLAVPDTRWITLIFFVVITPLAAFVSDHALAAMFLPIGMLLYRNSLTDEVPSDPQLAKLLMISIAMACNIGGPGAPSGGARNVIMMTYLSDMFGYDIGFFQWMTYCFPFVIIMIPVTWFVINWRFKPRIRSLAPSMEVLKNEISRMGGWSRQQIWAVIIFLVMLFGWFTEKDFYEMGILPFRLGIGVIAVAGAVAYLLAGVVSWRDYQQNVDWGVVWLYGGAIIFGRILDGTGAAYWLARSVIDLLVPLGMNSGLALMAVCNGLTALVTQVMADGPAAAAVGPVTLNIAGLVHPGTTYLPFMAMSTAISSSFAYCLIIGTPPNAIVYASGYLGPRDFLKAGIILWIVSMLVLLGMTSLYWAVRGFGTLPGF